MGLQGLGKEIMKKTLRWSEKDCDGQVSCHIDYEMTVERKPMTTGQAYLEAAQRLNEQRGRELADEESSEDCRAPSCSAC